jgi:hypothetical protein
VTASPARRIELMPLDDIPRADRNPKAHDRPKIRASIEKFGCTWAGLLDERTGRLVAGHGRLAVLTDMRSAGVHPPDGVAERDGEWLIPIVRGWASRSDAEAEAYLIADNRLSEIGGWDHRELAEVLDQIADDNPDLLQVTGYTSEDLADLLASFDAPPSLEDLADEYGDPRPDELWPILRFKIPPRIRDAFYEITEEFGDNEDSARFIKLVERVHAEAST